MVFLQESYPLHVSLMLSLEHRLVCLDSLKTTTLLENAYLVSNLWLDTHVWNGQSASGGNGSGGGHGQ